MRRCRVKFCPEICRRIRIGGDSNEFLDNTYRLYQIINFTHVTKSAYYSLLYEMGRNYVFFCTEQWWLSGYSFSLTNQASWV